ncbi:phosphocarrier protein FPr [Barrientosiimonas humi]|uniref:Phosphocarrier protein HPr n=1 Tax=Barrientosiimonas humi TaxID=999931 RepID=A0A542XAH4_9MICO|nr:dihydroxyacetone kinase phosphoryl donor subunit DhaM [Barrientosiimonas humi]TQL32849.1 phosphocarrier protein FPr [Barrientosiimonas humi]CAG7572840.1 Phosphoenolpyruvate-protein phosphotransferase [Barrientosiimonas humi]
MSVGLVVVSHSAQVAEGVVELASQMAPSVRLVAAGGDGSGGVGTSFDLISTALDEADTGDGVAILYDLGSALLTTEMALEMADPDVAERRVIVEAPVVEGAIAAAVAAEGGGGLSAVVAAAREAGGDAGADGGGAGAVGAAGGDAGAVGGGAGAGGADADGSERGAAAGPAATTRTVEIVNPLGLHARPAAELARLVSSSAVPVTVSVEGKSPVDLRSVMSVVRLGTRAGDQVTLEASGDGAEAVLDQVAEAVRAGFGEAGIDAPSGVGGTGGTNDKASPGDAERSLVAGATAGAPTRIDLSATTAGTPASPGLAVGPAHRLGDLPDDLPAPSRVGEPAEERERLSDAVDVAAAELDGGDDLAQAHAAILRDPSLLDAAVADLSDGAAQSWWREVRRLADDLAASDDEVVAARAIDVREAGARVLRHLGVEVSRIDESVSGAVVLADEVGPAEVTELVEQGAVGVALGGGSPTAHAVVVARGLGLPMVIRFPRVDDVDEGAQVVLDGADGTVAIDPPADDVRRARERAEAQDRRTAELREQAVEPVDFQGRSVLVAANVGSVADARAAVANGADGVGLLRTELLVLDRETYPDEDTQRDDLTEILDVLGDRPVVVRVLDAGGDKPVRTLDVTPEHNGFLGIRGLRYLLAHPELLHTQLRAIARASVGHRVSVMAPMVTTVEEAQAFREAVEAAVASLVSDGVEHAAPEAVGIMVEVPAAALTVEEFADVVDFVSVGSNDLAAYLSAADRTEPDLAPLLDPDSSAMKRVLDALTEQAASRGIPVAVCGEMAGDPGLAMSLLARGVWEVSMAPARIPAVKDAIRRYGR